jgi:hypothetical protein
VTAALLEALGVPQQVGLSADACLHHLLDVDAFIRQSDAGRKTTDNTDQTGRSRPKRSNISKKG